MVIFRNIRNWMPITNATIFMVIFILNRLTLYTSDDYTYHFLYQGYLPTEHPIKISGLGSLIQSQINHWQLWNGRFVAHTIVQWFMQFDKVVFDVANSFALVGLIHLIRKLSLPSSKRLKNNPFLVGCIAFYLWWFLPEIGKSILWVSGSGNYLWTSLIYLTYILFFLRKKPSFWLYPLGFLAGACNENSSPAILLIAGIVFVYRFLKDDISFSNGLSIFLGMISFSVMLLSPGSQKRGSIPINLSFLLKNATTIWRYLLSHYGVIYLLLLIVLFVLWRQKKLAKEYILRSLLFIIGHFSSAFALVLSPEIPERTFFGSSLFLAIALFSLLPDLVDRLAGKLKLRIFLIVLLIFSLHYSFVIKDLSKSYHKVQHHYQLLDKAESDDKVQLPLLEEPNSLYNAYKGTANLTSNSDSWFNQWMATYFEVKEIEGY